MKNTYRPINVGRVVAEAPKDALIDGADHGGLIADALEHGAAEAKPARTIKPENWQTLAGTLHELLGGYLTDGEIAEFRAGVPSAASVRRVVRGCRRCIHATYNGQQRAACKSLAQTLVNYNLIHRDRVADLLPGA